MYSLDAVSMLYLLQFEVFEYTIHPLFSLKLMLKFILWAINKYTFYCGSEEAYF